MYGHLYVKGFGMLHLVDKLLKFGITLEDLNSLAIDEEEMFGEDYDAKVCRQPAFCPRPPPPPPLATARPPTCPRARARRAQDASPFWERVFSFPRSLVHG